MKKYLIILVDERKDEFEDEFSIGTKLIISSIKNDPLCNGDVVDFGCHPTPLEEICEENGDEDR